MKKLALTLLVLFISCQSNDKNEFDNNVKTALSLNENPLELIYEGELNKQG